MTEKCRHDAAVEMHFNMSSGTLWEHQVICLPHDIFSHQGNLKLEANLNRQIIATDRVLPLKSEVLTCVRVERRDKADPLPHWQQPSCLSNHSPPAEEAPTRRLSLQEGLRQTECECVCVCVCANTCTRLTPPMLKHGDTQALSAYTEQLGAQRSDRRRGIPLREVCCRFLQQRTGCLLRCSLLLGNS